MDDSRLRLKVFLVIFCAIVGVIHHNPVIVFAVIHDDNKKSLSQTQCFLQLLSANLFIFTKKKRESSLNDLATLDSHPTRTCLCDPLGATLVCTSVAYLLHCRTGAATCAAPYLCVVIVLHPDIIITCPAIEN